MPPDDRRACGGSVFPWHGTQAFADYFDRRHTGSSKTQDKRRNVDEGKNNANR
jgi:hypothetical protein